MEHRWSVRWKVGGQVTVESLAGQVAANMCDISVGGVFVDIPGSLLRPNSRVSLGFTLPHGEDLSHHRLHAMVVRTTERGVALMYVDNAPETMRNLREALMGSRVFAPAIAWPGREGSAAEAQQLAG
jgi:hypothetical protein